MPLTKEEKNEQPETGNEEQPETGNEEQPETESETKPDRNQYSRVIKKIASGLPKKRGTGSDNTEAEGTTARVENKKTGRHWADPSNYFGDGEIDGLDGTKESDEDKPEWFGDEDTDIDE
jgi:hypothetical protein